MLTTFAAIAMLLTAAYLWRSAGHLQHHSVRPHGEHDVTSTGAVFLMRLTCIAVLALTVLFLATSRRPVSETNPPAAPVELDSHSAASESSLIAE